MISAIAFALALACLSLKFLRAKSSRDLLHFFCVLGLALSFSGIAGNVEQFWRINQATELKEQYTDQAKEKKIEADFEASLRAVGTNETAIESLRHANESLRQSHGTFWEVMSNIQQDAKVEAFLYTFLLLLFALVLRRVHEQSSAN